MTKEKQIEFKLRYKFRLILDETWSFGVLGRTGKGIAEQQNVDPSEIDMIIGSLAGPLCAGGGFCAGSDEIVEHQRISAAAYTFSAALPAMLATTASEALSMIQTNPDIIAQVRENIKTMWVQLDPRSDWVRCTSSIENPIMVLVLKPEVVATKKLRKTDQELLLQEVVDEVSFLRHESAWRMIRRADIYKRPWQMESLSLDFTACHAESTRHQRILDGSCSPRSKFALLLVLRGKRQRGQELSLDMLSPK